MQPRRLLVMIIATFFSLSVWSQKAAVTDIPMSEDTTISIKKGDAAGKCDKTFEIVEGTGQIEGEPALLAKDARSSWKVACAQWKKEIKEMNQDNKVLFMDCGKVTCSPQGAEGQVCRSEGSYKIKTKMN